MPKYIRPKQLKAEYGIGRVTAWRWGNDKAKGFPKPIRVSPNISLYETAELDRWFSEQRGILGDN